MGKSLQVFHNTKLEFLDIEQTSRQISEYFKKNVAFRIIRFDFEIDGKFDDKAFFEQYENYNHIKSFQDEEYLRITHEIDESESNLRYEIESEQINFDLYPSCVCNHFCFFNWNALNRNFLFKKDNYRNKAIQELRREIYEQVLLFGGTEAIYLSDENMPDEIDENISWADLKNKMIKKYNRDVLDIPDFYLSQEQERQHFPEYEDRAITADEFDKIINENCQLNAGIRDYYQVFLDDFRDLK